MATKNTLISVGPMIQSLGHFVNLQSQSIGKCSVYFARKFGESLAKAGG